MFSEASGIPCVVKLAETVGAYDVDPRDTDACRHSVLIVLHELSPALPYEGPRCNDGQLCRQKYGSGHNNARYVDAERSRRCVADEDSTVVICSRGHVGLPCCRPIETEFVGDVDRLNEQHIFTHAGSSAVGVGRATSSATEGLYRPKFTR